MYPLICFNGAIRIKRSARFPYSPLAKRTTNPPPEECPPRTTSFSAPVITGLAACLLEKDSSLTSQEVKKIIKSKKIALAPMCSSIKCEDDVKFKTDGAKTLNIPFEQPKNPGNCISCNKPANYLVRIGKSY